MPKKSLLKNSKGQSATEYMLVVAVIVLALVSAASTFIPKFQTAVDVLSANVSGWLVKNQEMSDPDG